MNESIGAYKSDAILRELLHMWQQLRRRAVRLRSTDRLDDPDMEPDRLAASLWFVKRLAATAGDIPLIGEAELLRMEMDDLEVALEHPESRSATATPERPNQERGSRLDHARTYSSDDIRALLETLVDPARRHWHASGANSPSSDWVKHIAIFVRRLAVNANDNELATLAKFITFAEEHRNRKREAGITHHND